ncbi:hypothetical protein KI688_001985 [Linnemannia hyalina]|uniref:Uncharacterized protein n=1 Tax=Linnemannia hyalina TaxID=64524 RepID=A0A9P8BS66_9FUNG|nr:hypothetical protein KI688_001985 [Linnemannia hyalina]
MAVAAAVAVLLCSVLDSTEAVKIAFSNYPVTLALKYGPYDISGCDSTYNGENPNVLFSSLRINRQVQVALLHLDDYAGGREALCNQCLMVTDLEGTKSIMVRLMGDCPGCVANELRLSPAAYEYLGDGYGQMDGFFSFTDCPDPGSKEAIDKFGPLKGRPPGPVPKIGL